VGLLSAENTLVASALDHSTSVGEGSNYASAYLLKTTLYLMALIIMS
jgi:hypothetical protein